MALQGDSEAEIRDEQKVREELAEFASEVPEGDLLELSPDPAVVGYRTVQRGERSIRLLTARINYGGSRHGITAGSNLDGVEAVIRDFRRNLFLMIPGVLALACLGGFWISRRALAPVDEITRVAKSISVQNLSKRLTVPQTGDELQRMSETWNEVLERLESAVARMRQFTADASHELRTPVALIRARAELALRRERQPEEYQKSLREIQSEAERMTDLTESLLTLARADGSGLEMPLTAVEINGIVRDVVRQNDPIAVSKGIALRAETAQQPAIAAANEAALRRLLLILIDNALQHTPGGGTVTVSAEPAEGGIRLAVRDSGAGIPAEALPHIFERFFRVDTARSGGNAGLGLSIAQTIAQAHDSAITVESEEGAGSRFALVLKS
jgi:heavy metal sensor kinase